MGKIYYEGVGGIEKDLEKARLHFENAGNIEDAIELCKKCDMST
jgi:hypothetical protein